MVRNWIINIILLISLIGILDAGYLTLNHFQGGEVGCFIVHGCDVVLTSKYATILNIPVSAFGLFYYLFIFICTLVYNFNRRKGLIKFVSIATTIGFLVSLGLLYLQIFVIKSFCSYCLLSAGTSGLLFLLGMYVLYGFSRAVDSITGEMVESNYRINKD